MKSNNHKCKIVLKKDEAATDREAAENTAENLRPTGSYLPSAPATARTLPHSDFRHGFTTTRSSSTAMAYSRGGGRGRVLGTREDATHTRVGGRQHASASSLCELGVACMGFAGCGMNRLRELLPGVDLVFHCRYCVEQRVFRRQIADASSSSLKVELPGGWEGHVRAGGRDEGAGGRGRGERGRGGRGGRGCGCGSGRRRGGRGDEAVGGGNEVDGLIQRTFPTNTLAIATIPIAEVLDLYHDGPWAYIVHLRRRAEMAQSVLQGTTSDMDSTSNTGSQTSNSATENGGLKMTVAGILGELDDDDDFARGEIAWCDPRWFLKDKDGIPAPIFGEEPAGYHPLIVVGRYTRLLGTDPCLLVLPCSHRLYSPLNKYTAGANHYTRNTPGVFVEKWGRETQISLSLCISRVITAPVPQGYPADSQLKIAESCWVTLLLTGQHDTHVTMALKHD
ncbi:hypothetical protein BJ165DRAFT_1399935 [Panaeolus papilionaceus]|nr:hypothetical protein BJ165DRAFT_1399935 [Panaeolus papilionaceus]